MKKSLVKIAGAALAALLATSFIGCPNPATNGGTNVDPNAIWEDATIVEELANKEISWGKNTEGEDIALVLPLSISKRLQVGSKIIVELDYNTIANDYIEFHVEDGAWGAVGVTEYYNAKGTKLDSEEEVDGTTKTGRFKIKVNPGVYYTVVTESVLAKLKAGCGFNGNFKLVKVGVTNLGEPEEAPGPAKDGDVVYEATGDDLTIEVAQNSYDADGTGVKVQGIQFAAAGATYLPAGAIAGDVYEINLVGKADADFTSRIQFLDASWGGIVSLAEGEDTEIPLTTFTAADFDLKLQVKFTKKTEDGFKFVIGKTELNAAAHTLTLTKFTITKVSSGTPVEEEEEPVVISDDDIELTEPAAKDGYLTFWAQQSGAAKGSVVFVLNYESGFELNPEDKTRTTPSTDPKKLIHPTYNKSVTLTDVEIKYIINDGEEQTYTAAKVNLPINEYGSDYQAKLPVFTDYKVTKNDAIYIKFSAKTNDENVVKAEGLKEDESIIQGNLIDTDPSVNYWREMCIEEQQKQLLSGITYVAPTESEEEEEEPAVAEPITYSTARKAYTLTTNDKTAKYDDIGLTFQYFVADGEDPVSVAVSGLKVSIKIGEAEAVVKTLADFTIEHHSWDGNAAESNARINLTLGTDEAELASGTTVVLQVLEGTVSDKSLVDGITFALQQDGQHNSWDMLTAADSHPFADAE